MFTKDELRLVDALASRKRIAEEDRDRVEALKAKLGVQAQAEIPERFVVLTGWANPAKDYPA